MWLPIPQDGIQNHDKIYCFQFPLDTTVIPREIKDNICKILGGKKDALWSMWKKTMVNRHYFTLTSMFLQVCKDSVIR